ncbi:glycerophosphodiester phosphodiesterase family protein [Novosphingobium album (ex Liu et al. 2023)]|uniref:Glycerophosphodiester phosphodiesterase family protein n=1 Tax=Novosphingobium album (ex Liu et al. 2023) TaxID=3031130 RepID=A0ABT5WKZ2_9SPHN|nr:glycerophosphodiester phosphodiesterase family protein [Novosphingobium album (ex Liu et al. 2023)]MDE8650709.1 glycerophosphodiester phosphodiesterase family protein [Novosphingobium album (ex Liu et al. 2023)]
MLLTFGALVALGTVTACARDGTLARNERLLRAPAAPGVMVASHRACWKSASENSLDGIRACIAHGIDIIEIDIRVTADGRLVLMHDSTLDRTTNGHGRVSEITFEALRKLRLKPAGGGRDITMLSDRQVPTLEEALAVAKGRILINMDAKDPVQERIFEMVEKTGMADQVIMKMSADPDAPELATSRFASRSMFIPVIFACTPKMVAAGQFCASALDPLLTRYDRYHPVGYELNYTDPAFIQNPAAATARGKGRLWINSLKPEQAGGVSDATAVTDPDGVWGKLIDQGATIIQTDHPEALLEYLRRRGLHQ